jgi:opacity protein-like surface antigen
MKKALIGVLFLVGGCGAWAQDQGGTQLRSAAAAANDEVTGTDVEMATPVVNLDLANYSPASTSAEAEPGPAPAGKPTPAKPKFVFGERDDYRFQLGVGVEFFRFQSDIYSASLVGLNTTLTYYTNAWFAVEGDVITGFAPAIYQNEHVKMAGGAGGIRIGGRRARFEPWGHVLVGADHLQPQTAGNSKTALATTAGIGVDYRVHSRLSFRLETDWVYTEFFKQTQNNFQGVAGVVLHF